MLARTLVALVVLLLPRALEAQRLVVQGRADHPAAERLREIAARDRYRLIQRDTVLAAGVHVLGDLVIAGANVRLEGSVEGAVAVLGGGLFVRPGARIGGPVVTAGGDLFGSDLAAIGDTLHLPAEFDVRLTRSAEQYLLVLTPPPDPPLIAPRGFFGLTRLHYDRVNGATIGAGVRFNLSSDTADPQARASVRFHSARAAFGGRASITVPVGTRWRATAAAAREPVTNETWIRGELANSAAALFLRSDAYNFYQSDWASLSLARLPPAQLQPGQGFVAPRLELRVERDHSLPAREPWSLFGDRWRPNPPVAEGVITSAVAGAAAGWRGTVSSLSGTVAVERALAFLPNTATGGDAFTHLVADGSWRSMGLGAHTFSVRTHILRTVGPEPAPPQRWSLIGGTRTLPTLELGALRGDNLVFVESSYAVPLPAVTLPFLGIPSIAVRHAAGTAWVTGTSSSPWEQNLGAGIQFQLLEAFVYVDPSDPSRTPTLSLGLSLPALPG